MRTRAEWTAMILEDVADIWRHMDEQNSAPTSAAHAVGMVKAGCRLILAGEAQTLAEGMAQAVLLLTMVREACIEDAQEKAEAS